MCSLEVQQTWSSKLYAKREREREYISMTLHDTVSEPFGRVKKQHEQAKAQANNLHFPTLPISLRAAYCPYLSGRGPIFSESRGSWCAPDTYAYVAHPWVLLLAAKNFRSTSVLLIFPTFQNKVCTGCFIRQNSDREKQDCCE